MFKFDIEKIKINTSEGTVELLPKKINVIVGPNNSGKSKFLKELRDYLAGCNQNLKIIEKIDHSFPKSLNEFEDGYKISSKICKTKDGNWMLKSYANMPNTDLNMMTSLENVYTKNFGIYGGNWKVYINELIEQSKYKEFFQLCGTVFFQYVGTEERLTICKKQRNYGMDTNGINFLSAFKFQEKLLKDLSDKVKLLFQKDVLLDYFTLGDRLVFRVGNDFDYIRINLKKDEETILTLNKENILDEQGDGLKSFVSTFLTLNFKNNDILLIDEPEAFLHPPLARQIGEMIAECENNNSIFIATHSVEVLKGILSKSNDVNVIRITQPTAGVNNVEILEQNILDKILQDPLLRVSRVLEGVFCNKVIITESEADELVYQELFNKIFPEEGAYFVHGQNKQTLAKIAELYKKIGVRYEIIVDFDILRVTSELNSFLSIMEFDDKEKDKIKLYADRLRKIIDDSVQTEGLDEKEIEGLRKSKRSEVYHKQGIRFFDDELQRKILETLEKLNFYHLHILPTGELETFLEGFSIEYKEKNIWIVEAILKIAELTVEELQKENNVYEFLKGIVDNK